ncbi:MAG: hypothetical protein AAGC57_12350 [Pseudomonadota bacterium]
MAEFIGSSKINLLPGTADKDGGVRALTLALHRALAGPAGL